MLVPNGEVPKVLPIHGVDCPWRGRTCKHLILLW